MLLFHQIAEILHAYVYDIGLIMCRPIESFP